MNAESRGDVDFLRLSRASDHQLRDFYTGLLQTTFPRDELESFEELQNSLAGGADGVLALVGERIGGGVVCEFYVGGAVELVSYLVVDPAIRGRRLGARLMELSLADSTSDLIVGEIEDPRFWEVTEQNDPEARYRFWKRLGCRLLPLRYVQPRLEPDRDRVRHLLLIAMPRAGVLPPDAVSGRLVSDFLREYFRTAEGRTPGHDAETRELLEQCAAPVLPLRSMDELDDVVPRAAAE